MAEWEDYWEQQRLFFNELNNLVTKYDVLISCNERSQIEFSFYQDNKKVHEEVADEIEPGTMRKTVENSEFYRFKYGEYEPTI